MAELARFQERMRLLMQLEAAESRVVAAVLERDKIRAELIAHIKDSAAATGACTNAVAAATAARLSPHRLQLYAAATDLAATEAATEPAAATEVLGVEIDSPMTPP
jgi:hypothetical protein